MAVLVEEDIAGFVSDAEGPLENVGSCVPGLSSWPIDLPYICESYFIYTNVNGKHLLMISNYIRATLEWTVITDGGILDLQCNIHREVQIRGARVWT